MSLEVNFAGIPFKNPVTTASGTFGSGMEYSEFVDLGRLGAVTTKGVASVKSNAQDRRDPRWYAECHRSAESRNRYLYPERSSFSTREEC